MEMILLLMIWFCLTSNTDMLLLMEKFYSNKGKSRHLDKRRWLFHNSQFPASRNRPLKKSHHKQNLSRKNNEIRMPYRTFKRGKKYKRLNTKNDKSPMFSYPKEIFAPVVKSSAKVSLNKPILYKGLIKKKDSSKSSLKHFRRKNMKTINYSTHNETNAHLGIINELPFNQTKMENYFNEDAIYFTSERKLPISTFSAVNISKFSPNSFQENFQEHYTPYKKPVYLRGIPKSFPLHRVIYKPKYLPFPHYLQSANAKLYRNFPTSVKKVKKVLKLPSEQRILPKIELQENAVFFSYSSPDNYFELPASAQNMVTKQNFPRDLPQTSAAGGIFGAPKYLTLPPYLRLTGLKPLQNVPYSIKETSFLTTNFASESTILIRNEQLATNTVLLDSSSSNFIKSMENNENSKLEEGNLFEEESITVAPHLAPFSEINNEVSFEDDENFGLGKHSAIVEEQNRIMHKNHTKNTPLNATTARMRNQYTNGIKPLSRTLSSTRSNGINTTEISSLQYLHHKLKEIKDIHGRLGNNTEILLWTVAAILITAILFLIFISAYRRYRDKTKKRYPFKKKRTLTLLRATRQEQKDLLETIMRLKGKKKTEEDFND